MNISYHITGNYPIRVADTDDQAEPCRVVSFPCGFENLDIAVYGHGLSAGDCVEAACQWMGKQNPAWTSDWEAMAEAAFVRSCSAECVG